MLANARERLRQVFGFEDFRKGQEEILEAILTGRDCLGVMPTGGGKSLCYQLPALLRPGVTLVVSPLIALMKDQVDGLVELGVSASFINSSLTWSAMNERLAALAAGDDRIVYVAPERFRNRRFLAALERVKIGLFAVDEAHCISMWGHDFRPDYRELRPALEALGRPQVIAVTATATPEVRDDIVAQLGLRHGAATVVRGFARPNLTLAVSHVSSHEKKMSRLLSILKDHPTGIVYCATRSSVEKVATRLAAHGISTVAYHAGLLDDLRRDAQNRFLSAEADVAVATNAFGMGIDRADLRTIVHWDVPGSMEAYYQEAGRAGRDGAPALCELLFNHADVRTQQFFIEGSNPSPAVIRATRSVLCDLCAEGPRELGAREVAETMGRGTNRLAIETAFRLLVAAGAIERSADSTTTLADIDADLTDTFADVAEKHGRDKARLRRLLRYIETRECRHRTILRYFGDPTPFSGEGLCDNCRRQAGLDDESRREPTEAEWQDIEHILRCVGQLNGRFGRGRIAEVLAGSRNKAIRAANLTRVPSYGALSFRSQPRIRNLIDALADSDCLATVGDEYPTVRLTRRGRALLEERGPLQLALAESSSPAQRKGAPQPPMGDAPAHLIEALRRFRTRLARERGVPPYLILHNKTIEAIAQAAPTDEAGLLAIKGMGKAKVASMGQAILDVLAEAGES